MASSLARERAAQAWCKDATKDRVMDIELCEAFADILDDIWTKPWLGNATNANLLDELRTRIQIHWDLSYQTTETV